MVDSPDYVITEYSTYVKQYVAALLAVLDENNVRANGVRALSREIRVSRSLANAVYVLVNDQDPHRHIAILPASRGRRTIYEALHSINSFQSPTLHLLLEADAAIDSFLKDRNVTYKNLKTLNVASSKEELNKAFFDKVYSDSFVSSCAMWGMKSEAIVRTCFVFESKEFEDCWAVSTITNILGLQRLREGPSVPIYVPVAHGSVVDPFVIRGQPFDKNTSSDFLLHKYSSDGLHASEIAAVENGSTKVLKFGTCKQSRSGPLDVCASDYMDNAGSNFAENEIDRFGAHLYSIRFPTETLILELLLPKKMDTWGPPASFNYGTQLHYGQVVDWNEDMQLPLHCNLLQIDDMYSLPSSVKRVSLIHKNAIEEVLNEQKTSLSNFDCYRLEFSHPPLNSLVTLEWELTKKR